MYLRGKFPSVLVRMTYLQTTVTTWKLLTLDTSSERQKLGGGGEQRQNRLFVNEMSSFFLHLRKGTWGQFQQHFMSSCFCSKVLCAAYL